MQMKWRLFFALVMGLGCALFLGASLAVAGDAGPQPACPAYYTVRWGDTLAKIAASRGIPLRDLLDLNRDRVRNPNLIYAGQILCVPAQRQVSLQVTYHFKPAGDDSTKELLARGGYLGRVVSYPIQNTDLFSTTREITSTFAAFPPVLLGVRNNSEATDYTLYVIGDGRVMLPLVLTDTQALVSVLPLDIGDGFTPDFAILGANRADNASATLKMETGGSYFPFELTLLAHFPTADSVLDSVDNEMIGFAIAPAGPQYPGAYYVVMRLEGNIVGPPGATRSLNCSRWSGWGWFYRWLRGWYGC